MSIAPDPGRLTLTPLIEEPQHRQHAPVVLAAGAEVELGEDSDDVLLYRAVADH